MNEQQIQAFCKVTGCDRRVAAYCLYKHNGVYEPALVYYFDDINQIRVPDSFKTEPNGPKASNAKGSPRSPKEISSRKYDLIPSINIPSHISPVSSTETKFFFPNNAKKIETNDVNIQAKITNDTDLGCIVPQRNGSKKHKFCTITIWRNGVAINDKFYSVNDKNYNTLMKDINNNNIPLSVCSETDIIDFVNNSSLSYEPRK